MSVDFKNQKLLFTKAALFAVSLVFLGAAPEVLADSLPQELIPPDVTLTPASSTPSAASIPQSTNAPGLAGGASSGAPGQPPAPPAGSSAYGGPKGAPGGHAAPQTPPGSGADSGTPDPIAVIDTARGQITIRLFKKYAPQTVNAFVDMVSKGFYNGLTFHRVEPGFVIQGGCPKGNGSGMFTDPKTNQPRMLMLETSPYLKHNAPGVVAMARFPKNQHSASCQFYITLQPQPRLDQQYTIFGGVLQGLDVVGKIQIGDQIKSVTMIQN